MISCSDVRDDRDTPPVGIPTIPSRHEYTHDTAALIEALMSVQLAVACLADTLHEIETSGVETLRSYPEGSTLDYFWFQHRFETCRRAIRNCTAYVQRAVEGVR